MKYIPVVLFLVLLACACNSNDEMTKLLSEQKLLKDSANHINDKIGDYLRKGVNDSAETQRKQLAAVHARLIEIQFSMDSLEKMKK
jgi:hypothetical protein